MQSLASINAFLVNLLPNIMFLFTYTAASLSLTFLVSAIFIFIRRRSEPLSFFLALHLLADALWIGSNAAADIAATKISLIFWSGAAFVGASFFISFFLAFVDAFVSKAWPKKKHLLFYIGPSVFFSLFAFSKYSVVDTIFPPNMPTQIIPGILYKMHIFFLFGSLIYGLIRLFRLYANTDRQTKSQIIYMSIGFLMLFVGAATFGLILPLLGELRFFSVGPQFAVFLFGLSTYAIFKHKLLDIKIAIQRSVVYAILLSLITATYLLLLFILNNLIVNMLQSITVISAGITTILGILTFPSLKEYFNRTTNQLFFKNSYDYTEAMDALSEVANKNIDPQELIKQISQTLKTILQITHVTFVRSQDANLRAHDDISIPIIAGNKPIGFLLLGKKLSGDPYTSRSMQLLKTFAYQAGVAIQRAELYEIVKKHAQELELKVQERTEKIQRLQEEQKQMIIDVSHGLQTPLTVLKGELNFLKRHSPQNINLETFEKSIDRFSKLIYDLISLTRLENQNFIFKPINFSAMISEQIEYFNTVAKERGIELSGTIAPDIIFTGQKDKLQELVINLVSNALKYIPEDKAKKIVTIKLSRSSASIQLTVADTGIGITEGNLPFIFNRFYRIRNNRVPKVYGIGLGLSISKKIVEKHNGTITVESKYGQGTKFTVTFPN